MGFGMSSAAALGRGWWLGGAEQAASERAPHSAVASERLAAVMAPLLRMEVSADVAERFKHLGTSAPGCSGGARFERVGVGHGVIASIAGSELALASKPARGGPKRVNRPPRSIRPMSRSQNRTTWSPVSSSAMPIKFANQRVADKNILAIPF